MLTRYQLSNNALVPTESEDSPIMVYVNPDANEKNHLLSAFNIDEHTLSSALDPDEVSRVEFADSRIFSIWKRPMNYSGQDNFFFNVASVGLFLSQDRLVIILTEEIPLMSNITRTVTRYNTIQEVFLSFLYNSIHHYLEHLKVIKMISRDLQAKINTSMENIHLIQMFNLSESLVYYVNAISTNNVVLSRLRSNAEKLNLSLPTIEFLDDIIIENNQCLKQAEIYSNVFSGLMDARTSLVNNNMNVLLKNLTIINIVFLPLNLIASIGGMSEYSMMTQGVHWGVSYSLFMVAIVIIGWITAFLLGHVGVGGGNPKIFKRRKKKRK
jgi:magnesium transporter